MAYCERAGAKVEQEVKIETIELENYIKEENKEEQRNMVLVGHEAPKFSAPAYYKGELTTVNLEDYRGKWVMLCFYPGDFTFVCGTEVAAVASKNEEFEKLGVQVISVSVDSQFVHKIWDEQEISKMAGVKVPFPMVTDSAGMIGKQYGVYEETAGVDVRGRFLIDPDGIVQAMEVLTPPVGRNVNEALRQIKAYQLVRETNSKEFTPAGWVPGKKTLKLGTDLIGKVWENWSVSDL